MKKYQESKTHAKEHGFGGFYTVPCACVCFWPETKRGAKWWNCAQIHALCTGNKVFLTQKLELSRMCTTQSRVLKCPRNRCRAFPPTPVVLKLFSWVTLFWTLQLFATHIKESVQWHINFILERNWMPSFISHLNQPNGIPGVTSHSLMWPILELMC